MLISSLKIISIIGQSTDAIPKMITGKADQVVGADRRIVTIYRSCKDFGAPKRYIILELWK
jgi:hypothetical protein